MPERPADPGPLWARPEPAWGAALLAGFAGAWLGLQLPLPGAAPLLATVLLLPLHAGLLGRDQRLLLTATTLVWTLGVAGAVVGTLHEAAAPAELAGRLPGAAQAAALHLGFLEGAAPAGLALTLPRELLGLVLLAALARTLWGAPALLLLGLAVAALAGAAAGHAGLPPGTPALEVFAAWPPHLVPLLAGGALLVPALAEPAPLAPPQPLAPVRRQLLAAAASLIALGLAGQAAWTPIWRGWLADRLG